MKLRSAQFVLLVLLLSSLRLSEGSSLRLADELIGNTGATLSQRATSRTLRQPGTASTQALAATPVQDLSASGRRILRAAWSMRQPAAHAVSVHTLCAAAPATRRI